MVSTPKVIWVAQWYPHDGELYAGDFIQRHARAVALYQPIHVFSCFPHVENRQETRIAHNLTETIIYFKPAKTGIKSLDKLLRWKKWKQLLQSAIKQYIQTNGKPNFMHCHITLNAGWLGLWAKRKYGIPYLITEHWSGYMPGAFNGFEKYNRWSKSVFHTVIKQALCVATVSKALMTEMQLIEKESIYTRVPNVVDESVFFIRERNNPLGKKRLLHISTFSGQKNLPAMLAAFDALAVLFSDIEFHLVGPLLKFKTLFPQQSFNKQYVLHGEISQLEIADLMQQCDACVLYSHYETFGCVIIEANASGLPVIVSDIAVLREIVRDKENGVLVRPNDPTALLNAIQTFYAEKESFNSLQIATQAKERYSFSVVGREFYKLYQSLVFNA